MLLEGFQRVPARPFCKGKSVGSNGKRTVFNKETNYVEQLLLIN